MAEDGTATAKAAGPMVATEISSSLEERLDIAALAAGKPPLP